MAAKPDLSRASIAGMLVPPLSPARTWPRRYGLSAVVWISMFLVTAAYAPAMQRSLFTFLWVAVLFAAWYGGLGPALLASLASVIAVNYYVVPRVGDFSPIGAADLFMLATFIIVAASVSALVARLADEQRTTAATAHELVILTGRLQDQQRELVTSNARLAESEGRWRRLADAAPVLVWTSGLDGRRDFFNQSWLDFTGRPLARELDDGWAAGVHPDDRPHCLATHREAFDARRPFRLEYRLRRHDGSYRWILDTGVPRGSPTQAFVGFIGSCIDITERHEVEVDRERARRDAEAANRAKSEFLAVMSHELRTPLNAIGGYVELLELELRGPVSGEQRDALQRIRRNAHRLLTLVNDVLHVARLEAGGARYEIGTVPVGDALAELEPLLEPQLVARALVYEHRRADPTLAVRADRVRLQQIVLNLLANAVKFTARGGTVRLECAASDTDVHIRVTDTGVGIPADKIEAIFHPFVQLDQGYTRTHDGTGLGLAISRDLARAMGGEVAVERSDSTGSCFVLSLPRAEEEGGQGSA